MCQSGQCIYEESLSGDCTLNTCILIKDIDKKLEESGLKLDYEEPEEPLY